ncbi:hypothetical protein DFH09DRAFT_1335897 [Mycena vulgaris]|nr:hypothetical protein DFH09DRAFT_1335897 [Mycena vulgaris]
MPRDSGLLAFALLSTFFTLATALPLHSSEIHRALTKRAGSTGTATTVVIGITFAGTVAMFGLCCCCIGKRAPPEPTPQEVANEVDVLRARVQQLEADRAGAGPSAAPVVAPPTYTP